MKFANLKPSAARQVISFMVLNVSRLRRQINKQKVCENNYLL